MDQQRLMEDILKGRLTIAQLAEIEKQRRLQQQGGTGGGQSSQPVRPAATRIAADRIEPDRSPPSRPVPPRTSLGQTAPLRTQRPAVTPRPPSGPESTVITRSRRVPVAIPNSRPPTQRRTIPATSTAAARTANVPSSKLPDAGGSDRPKTAGGGDKPAGLPSAVPINQQIHRILSSHRGARTAWLLAEILGPPVALRPEDDRRF